MKKRDERLAAAYVRVSSRSQNTRTQVQEIDRVNKARSNAACLWYEEKRSAKTLERPQLQMLLECVRAGKIRTLYVYRIDRLTRSGIRDTLDLVNELRTCGCKLVSCADGFSVDGPASEIILAVMGWAAQMERLAIGERIASARKRVEANGGHWGRPRALLDANVRRIHALSAEGETSREIARRLRVSKSSVLRVLGQKGAYARARKPKAKRGARAPRL